jgi:AmiR/NasT family two-component response regulator
MKVLILENELLVKKDLEMQLRRHGCEVSCDEYSGNFDYVIIGQMSYLKTMRNSLKSMAAKTKLILFTTHSNAEMISASNDFTSTIIISKPLQSAELMNHLKPV